MKFDIYDFTSFTQWIHESLNAVIDRKSVV